MPDSQIHFHHKLGEGSFGEVLLGSFRGTKVAIKRMHEGQVHKAGDEGLGTAAQVCVRGAECKGLPQVIFIRAGAPSRRCQAGHSSAGVLLQGAR